MAYGVRPPARSDRRASDSHSCYPGRRQLRRVPCSDGEWQLISAHKPGPAGREIGRSRYSFGRERWVVPSGGNANAGRVATVEESLSLIAALECVGIRFGTRRVAAPSGCVDFVRSCTQTPWSHLDLTAQPRSWTRTPLEDRKAPPGGQPNGGWPNSTRSIPQCGILGPYGPAESRTGTPPGGPPSSRAARGPRQGFAPSAIRRWLAEHERKLMTASHSGPIIVESPDGRAWTLDFGPWNASADGRESSCARIRMPALRHLRISEAITGAIR